MTTFVLVHGAWHGDWTWQRVTPLLTATGARVITPDLPADPEAGLRTHVDVVVDALKTADDPDTVLVGHSYGGLVVRQAADREPGRVSRLVLVDGWAGTDGASQLSLIPERFSAALRASAAANDDPRLIPAPRPELFGVEDAGDIALLAEHLRPQPLRTFTDATRLTGAIHAIPGRTLCCQPPTMPFEELARAAGYDTIPIDGPHDIMLTDPETVAREILRTD